MPAEAVTPLIRGLVVLRLLTDAGGRQSVGDLARGAGLARSTVDRVVSTLRRMGYLREDGRDAVLTPGLMELGNAYLDAIQLPDLLGPHADRLADLLDESVSIAVPDGDGVRFVHQATRRRALPLSFRIGDLLPAERTAAGQALAGDRDWAQDNQQIERGLIALALPVHDPSGRLVCAVSVVSHTSRHSVDSLRETTLLRLREAVLAMERELRDAPPEPRMTPTAPTGLASWTAASKQELGPEFVESLARGLTVLTAFGAGRAELTLTAIAEATGLPRATARRALITLEHLGYLHSQGRTFQLTPQVLALGFAPLSRLTLARIAQPHLAELAAEIHDSASLAVLAGDGAHRNDIQYTARVATDRIMSVSITVGTRFPAFATSMGRVLLADLPAAECARWLAQADLPPLTRHTVTSRAELAALLDQVARDGYALVDEELEEGLRSLAVPVRDLDGQAVAAVNVAMHVGRRTADECRAELLPLLRAVAARIQSDLWTASRFVRIPSA